MKFFSYDSKFSQLIMKVAQGCYLNLLWMVFSLPIFTMGAATAALYRVMLKLAGKEKPSVIKQFIRGFKENFRQATILWLILIGVGLLLGADGYILYRLSRTSTGAPAVIWTLMLALVIAAVSVITRLVGSKNELLYLGLFNVSVGVDLQALLSDGFIEVTDEDPGKNEVYVYAGLYVSDDPPEEYHEYSYASKLKLLASVNAKQMDVVLLNRESYDIFSRSGYLLDLDELLRQEDPVLLSDAVAYLTKNGVVLEDNAMEVQLGTADAYQAETASSANGLEVSEAPLLASAGFSEPVYLCVIANSPRLPEAVAFIRYILSPGLQ